MVRTRQTLAMILALSFASLPAQSINEIHASHYVARLPQSYAVLLVDMQPEILNRSVPADVERAVANQLRVLELCARYDVPVMELEFKGRGATIPVLEQALASVPRHAIYKKDLDDAKTAAMVYRRLSQWGATDVFLMGGWASMCVRRLASDLVWPEGGARKYGIATGRSVILDSPTADFDLSSEWYVAHGCFLEEFSSIELLLSEAPPS